MRQLSTPFILAASCVLAASGCTTDSSGQPSQANDALESPSPQWDPHIDLAGQSGVDEKLAGMRDRLEHALSLVLHRTDITGTGLSQLKIATKLKTLDLRQTSITDEDLQQLRGMAQLDYLVLDGSQVTDDGIVQARSFLPRTLITPMVSRRK